MPKCLRRARLRLRCLTAVAAAHLTSTPRRTAAVPRPAVPVAGTKSTKVANESPALAPGFLFGPERVPCPYNLRSFFAGRFHRS
jgi:hypothetical protein